MSGDDILTIAVKSARAYCARKCRRFDDEYVSVCTLHLVRYLPKWNPKLCASEERYAVWICFSAMKRYDSSQDNQRKWETIYISNLDKTPVESLYDELTDKDKLIFDQMVNNIYRPDGVTVDNAKYRSRIRTVNQLRWKYGRTHT